MFILVIETPCESFVVLAADAELIKEEVTFDTSVNLVSILAVYVAKVLNLVLTEPLNVFNESILTCCDADEAFKLVTETFTLADVLSKLVNLIAFEPVKVANVENLVSKEAVSVAIALNCDCADAVNAFKRVVELLDDVKLFKFAIEIVFADAVVINEPLIVANAVALVSKLAVSVPIALNCELYEAVKV